MKFRSAIAQKLGRVARRNQGGSRAKYSRLLRSVPGLEAFCAAHAISEANFLQTIFGFLIAINTENREITVATAYETWFGQVDVASLVIRPDETLMQMANEWSSPKHLVEVDRYRFVPNVFVDALELPAFSYGSSTPQFNYEREVISSLFPFSCSVTRTADYLSLVLDADADSWTPHDLSAFIDQFEATITAVLDGPDSSSKEVACSLPPLRFYLTIAANFELDTVAATMEYWGTEVGMPISVRTVQLGEVDSLDSIPESLGTPFCGATVLVTRSDEWEACHNEARTLVPVSELPVGHTHGRLPNGAPVIEMNANETREMFHEIFTQRTYLRHGLRISDGATVVDVGGNIGLFTLFAHHEAVDVTIHVFEPVAEIAELLSANIEMYGVNAIVHGVALGVTPGMSELTYYPNSTLQSGLHADRTVDKDVVRQYARHRSALALTSRPQVISNQGDKAGEIESLISGRFTAHQRMVSARTLSQIIDDHGLTQIDFLKVDVERAELNVLLGLREEHWRLIKQVVVEVHDIHGRVGQVRGLLQEHGFQVVVEQQPLFAGTELFMVYAQRPEYPAKEDADTSEAHHAAFLASASAWTIRSGGPVYAVVGPSIDGASRPSSLASLRAQLAKLPDIQFLDLSEPFGNPEDPDDSSRRYTIDAGAAFGTALFRHITRDIRPQTKAIVVDADDLLWGGICGEVGPANVLVDPPFREVQKFLANQRTAGRLLFLSSKNTLADIDDVFARHPDMPLRLSDFAAVRVNWESKAENIVKMAGEFCIALESVVFIDDSPTERAEIATRLPEVTVVALPADPTLFVESLRGTWALDINELTAEDSFRAAFVDRDGDRKELGRTSATFAEYLQQLHLEVAVSKTRPSDIDRISQLARRTNQFNLMLTRHSTEDVRRLLVTASVALSIHLTDRFGKYGLIGFVAGGQDDECLEVCDLFLSCRALGRNIEWAILQHLGEHVFKLGIEQIRFRARRGERNQPALTFLGRVAAYCNSELDAEHLSVTVPSQILSLLDWTAISTQQMGSEAGPHISNATRSSPGRRQYAWPVAAEPIHVVGKLLRVDSKRPDLSTPYVAPQTDAEVQVAAVWTDLLGIERPGVHDDLIACGGDSLTALAICARLRHVLAGC